MTTQAPAWIDANVAPIHEQAKARGMAPPVGYTADMFRIAGFDVRASISPEAVYVAAPDSPTGHKWDVDSWDAIAWWLSDEMGDVTESERAFIVACSSSEEWRRGVERRAASPSELTREQLAAAIVALPLVFQREIDARLNRSVENVEAIESVDEINRAMWGALLALNDKVSVKFGGER